ncbi:hypothetical protein [Tessaracoccus aquimaris]|nr:hypothetical protein [Tessaracoccus aquimaris]
MQLLLELPQHGAHAMGPMLFGLMMFKALLFGLLIFAVIKLVKHRRLGPVGFAPRGAGPAGGHPHGWAAHRPAEDAAFDTLRMRLANGDITPEEYLERSSVLRTPQEPRE